MKTESKSWKDIATELGKPQWALKNRFKEINKDGKGDGGGGAGGDGNGEGKDGEENNKKNKVDKGKGKQAKTDQAKNGDGGEDKGKDDNEKDDGNGKESGGGKGGETKFTLEEWIELTEDDTFSFKDLLTLGTIVAKDDAEHWERIASSYFDMTGQRVAGADIREKMKRLDKTGSSKDV